MASKLLKRFVSSVSPAVGVALFKSENGVFFTIKKTNYKKETNQYEENPFYRASDLAALSECAKAGIQWLDANPQRKEKSSGGEGEAPAELSSKPEDEIPF